MDLNAIVKWMRGLFLKAMHGTFIERIVSKITWSAGFEWDDAQGIFVSRPDAWQHNVGYFTLYDKTAPLSGMFIHCDPIRFHWDGRDWNIELWKGQYDVCAGAEIGVYVGSFQPRTGDPAIDHTIGALRLGTDTNCPDRPDWLEMSFRLLDPNGEVFRRDQTLHWWLTGFKPFQIDSADRLRMEIRLALKDSGMRVAFVEGLVNAGWSETEYTLDTSDPRTVHLVFTKPHG